MELGTEVGENKTGETAARFGIGWTEAELNITLLKKYIRKNFLGMMIRCQSLYSHDKVLSQRLAW